MNPISRAIPRFITVLNWIRQWYPSFIAQLITGLSCLSHYVSRYTLSQSSAGIAWFGTSLSILS